VNPPPSFPTKRTWAYHGVKKTAWLVNWHEDGLRHRRQFPTKREATLFRDKLVQDVEATVYGALKGPITLKEFVDVYEKAKSWRTDSYRERSTSALLRCSLRTLALHAIRPEMVQHLRQERLQGGAAPATVRQELASLSDCFGWAVKLGYLRKNPAAGVEKPPLSVKQDDPAAYIPKEEFEKILNVSGRDAPIFQFAAWTGLRITELIQLEWPDVNLRDGFLVVRRGKGRKQRIVPLLPEAQSVLQKAPRRHDDPRGRIFYWSSDRHALLRRFQRRCKKAEMPIYKFHHLRHSFASWAAMSGVSLEVIAQVLGHTSITVTKKYAHLHPDYQRNELGKMSGAREAQQLYKSARKKRLFHS